MAERLILKMRTFVTIISLISAVKARFPNSAEGRVREYLLNQANFSSRNRPVLNSDETVEVVLTMEIAAMLDLNERDQVITTASFVTLKWKDERLLWNPEDFNNTDLATMYVDEIWTPQISMINSVQGGGSSAIPSSNQGQILVTSEGDVVFSEQFIQSSRCLIFIRYFPFDIQGCSFLFHPGNKLAENIFLTVEVPENLPTIYSSEWELMNVSIRNFKVPVPFYVSNRPFGEATSVCVCAVFKRDPYYYLQTLIAPSALLCIMSTATFLAPPDSGERVSLGVSMVLGLTVFQLLVADTLPTSSKEPPILNIYLFVNFVLACLAVLSSLGNLNVAYGDSRRLATVTFHKHPRVKNFVLEYLPRALAVLTYRERVEREVAEVTSMDISDVATQSDSNLSVTGESSTITKVHPMEPFALNEKLSHNEKKKLETRTIAVVLDRLALAGFLVVIIIVNIVTVTLFLQNPGTSYVNCCE